MINNVKLIVALKWTKDKLFIVILFATHSDAFLFFTIPLWRERESWTRCNMQVSRKIARDVCVIYAAIRMCICERVALPGYTENNKYSERTLAYSSRRARSGRYLDFEFSNYYIY